MRTYEDVKEALKSFEDELKRESGIKRDHYIIMGGNVNVVKKGVGEYALGKGTPVPMIWETAKKKQTEFQEKCGDNIRLEIIKYSDWLIKNIDECKKLMEYMRQQFSSGEDSQKKADPEPEPETTPESVLKIAEIDPEPEPKTIELSQSPMPCDCTTRQMEMSCPTCPYGIKTCMVCKFASGINMNVFPWEIVCSIPNKPIKG